MTAIASGRLAISLVGRSAAERQPMPNDPADPRFRRLLGEEAWQQLPEPIRNRFSKRLPPGGTFIYQGEVVSTEIPAAGRVLVTLARLIGSPLPLDDGATGPSVVTVMEAPKGGGQSRGQIWQRSYTRGPRRTWSVFGSAFPSASQRLQIVRSTKCFAGPTGLEEQVGGGFGMALRVSVEEGRLVFRSQHYFLKIGPFRLILPNVLSPGRMEIVHTQLPDGQFSFGLTVTHPQLGLVLRQLAHFSDPAPTPASIRQSAPATA